MPELPEVQTIVNDLKKLPLRGNKIRAVKFFWANSVNGVPQAYLRKHIAGRTILGFSRRGKYIVLRLDDGSRALFHLRMSGRMHFYFHGCPVTKYEQVLIDFQNGMSLRLHDPRKFGRFFVGPMVEERLACLGPEPLDNKFRISDFKEILARHRRMLKPLLLDQHVLAGLGNIYVDEALWRAWIHPQQISCTLNERQAEVLFNAIRHVLKQGINNAGTSLGASVQNFRSVSKEVGRNKQQLFVYSRTGLPCKRCKTLITKMIVAQRGTHICAECQKFKA